MKLLGLIGGTSWHATVVYYTRINQLSAKFIGEASNPPLLLYSQDISVMRSGDIDRINNSYLKIAQSLEREGADAIVIAANTPHLVVPFVQSKIGIPILHIADSTAEEAKRIGVDSVGLLGTLPTMKKDFLTGRLRDNHGLNVILPDTEDQPEVHRFISEELTQGEFSESTKSYYIKQMDKLVANGAQAIMLGCTELPILFNNYEYQVPLLDTTELHVKAAVEYIFS